MKKLLVTLISGLAIGAALPALAGPDWPTIEKARKDKRAQTARSASADAASGARKRGCPPAPLVLSVDHGPRVQSTPRQEQKRKERYEAQLRACKDDAAGKQLSK